MNEVVTYRPKSNLVWGSVALFLDALYLIQAIFYPVSGESLVGDLLLVAAIAVLVWCIWLRPKIVLHSQHLVVVNPLTTTQIDYQSISELNTQWALQIVHSGGQTRVWVAPASGKFRWIADSNQRGRYSKIPTSQGSVIDVTSMSQSLGSDSGLAAHLIRVRLENLH